MPKVGLCNREATSLIDSRYLRSVETLLLEVAVALRELAPIATRARIDEGSAELLTQIRRTSRRLTKMGTLISLAAEAEQNGD